MKKLVIALLTALIFFGSWLLIVAFREEPTFDKNFNEKVNTIRAGYDLNGLAEVEDLNVIAQMKCEDMVSRNYYDHINPNGKQAWEQYNFSTYVWAGENLARGYRNAYETVEGWRNSPKHLENLVNPNYKEVGYGVCKDKNGYFYVVQEFRG